MTVPPDCVHHWRIEPASNELSPGTCRNCGAHRMFRNSLVQTQEDWRVLGGQPSRPFLRGLASSRRSHEFASASHDHERRNASA